MPPSFFKAVDSCSLTDDELRQLIRAWIESMLDSFYSLTAEEQLHNLVEFTKSLKAMPVAIHVEDAKDDMYELPPEFMKLFLGKRLKYSCLYYPEESCTVDQAEDAMLELCFQRAQIEDGQSILDLGGGWGAMAVFIAEKCPTSHITTISNSKSQKEYVDNECRKRGITNVQAIDADLITLEHAHVYDRVICIEVLEYFKNYSILLKKVSSWMKPNGLLFIQGFNHKLMAMHLEHSKDEGIMSWLSKYFFLGLTIPSSNLMLYFQEEVCILDHWILSGKQYSITSDDNIKLLDRNIDLARPIFASVYGEDKVDKWVFYWRTMFMIFSEMFKFNNGEEWITCHYLFTKKCS